MPTCMVSRGEPHPEAGYPAGPGIRRYVEWCNRSHRYTSCREWSEKVLGVRLGSESICMESERQHAHVYDSICIPVCIYVDIRNDRI